MFTQGIIQYGQQLGYGLLYNWYAGNDQNFAPTDWKLPSYSEYETLANYLIANGYNYDDTITGNKIGIACTIGDWKSSNTDGNVGNNNYPSKRNITGLSIKGGGLRSSSTGEFVLINEWAYLMTTTLLSETNTKTAGILWDYKYSFGPGTTQLKTGCSVRLLYTGTGTPTSLTDYDGNVYNVIKLGDQYWLGQNWKCKHLNNGNEIPNVISSSEWIALTTKAWCYYNNKSKYM